MFRWSRGGGGVGHAIRKNGDATLVLFSVIRPHVPKVVGRQWKKTRLATG
jgi:hypothetical protein